MYGGRHLRRRAQHGCSLRSRKQRIAVQFGAQQCLPGHGDWCGGLAEFHRSSLFSQRQLPGSGDVEWGWKLHILSAGEHCDRPVDPGWKRDHQDGVDREHIRQQLSGGSDLSVVDARAAAESMTESARLPVLQFIFSSSFDSLLEYRRGTAIYAAPSSFLRRIHCNDTKPLGVQTVLHNFPEPRGAWRDETTSRTVKEKQRWQT